ncbi:MAG: DUF4149 domain-containing protein [Candidatus Eremiobacteraeota bacterium]|nr:DUF4149 domain-containing protein [Candidatus Eremiobacteraeota bacterium]
MIERLCTAIETVSLGVWAGAMAGFAFIFAPAAFRGAARMDAFAALVAACIRGIGSLGLVCGALAIGAALVRSRAISARRFAALRVALVVLALGASRYETEVIIPAMTATAAQIGGPVDSVPKSDPRRAAYDAQHRDSSRVYGAAFLCVLAASALAAFGRTFEPNHRPRT